MSGARPETPEELHMLAGEYVLGVLGSAEMRAVDRTATADPQLARAIAGWERRFAPMLTAVQEVAPPDALWARIEHAKSLPAGESQDAKPPPRLVAVPSTVTPATMAPASAGPAWQMPAASRRVWPWKVATAASMALAAGLAGIVLMPSQAGPVAPPVSSARDISLVAVLTQPESLRETRQDAAPQMATDTGIGRLVDPQTEIPDPARAAARIAGFIAASWPDGTVVLTAFAPVQVAGGKTLELWSQPPNTPAPKSLGLLPPTGLQAVLPVLPVAGTVLSVSVEPPGGSPTGAPTGRVVYAGMLRQIRKAETPAKPPG